MAFASEAELNTFLGRSLDADLTQLLLDGRADPLDTVSRIHTVAVSPLGHPFLLQPWCDLDGGFTTDEKGMVTRLDGQALLDAVQHHASQFLEVGLAPQLDLLRREMEGPA